MGLQEQYYELENKLQESSMKIIKLEQDVLFTKDQSQCEQIELNAQNIEKYDQTHKIYKKHITNIIEFYENTMNNEIERLTTEYNEQIEQIKSEHKTTLHEMKINTDQSIANIYEKFSDDTSELLDKMNEITKGHENKISFLDGVLYDLQTEIVNLTEENERNELEAVTLKKMVENTK